MLAPGPFQVALEFSQIVVWKDAQACATQLCGVDERGVAKFVEQDDIIFRNERRNRTQRRGVSAAETKRSLRAFPFSQRPLQTHMLQLRPADQPRRACADSEFVDGSDRRFTESRIICKPEVIVRGKVDKAARPAVAPYHRNFRSLRTADFKKMSIECSRPERLSLLCEEVLHHKRLNCDANQL